MLRGWSGDDPGRPVGLSGNGPGLTQGTPLNDPGMIREDPCMVREWSRMTQEDHCVDRDSCGGMSGRLLNDPRMVRP